LAKYEPTSRYLNLRSALQLVFNSEVTDWSKFVRVDRIVGDRYTSIEASEDSSLHTVKEGETLPTIARMYYKDSHLWHIIADHNPLETFYPFDLTPLTVLEIPPLRDAGEVPSSL
jgi:nucleoid-associated protein YgaU